MRRRANPLRVRWYRRWCWWCREGAAEELFPCAAGFDYAQPGEAADAARRHFSTAHGERS